MSWFRSKRPTVKAGDLMALKEDGAQVIDVRTAAEWRAGHLPFARHIPLEDLGRRADEIDPKTMAIFVCRMGNRSKRASSSLGARGYQVANLVGGVRACARAGLKLVNQKGAPGKVV